MSRKRGRPSKLNPAIVERTAELRARGASYAAIAKDIGVSKRTIMYWSSWGRGIHAGLHREVRRALLGADRVVPSTPPPPSAIYSIVYASVVGENGWGSIDRNLTIDEIQQLRAVTDRRQYNGWDSRVGDAVVSEICKPRAGATLTPTQSEFVARLLEVRVETQEGPLKIAFAPPDNTYTGGVATNALAVKTPR